ncbi:MAG: ZIP family metal transporter [Patescibacteria group bacterium]
MFAESLPIFAATILGALAFLSGGVLSHKLSHFIAHHSGPVIAFASGAMLAVTFAHVLPESIAMGGEYAFLAVFAGVVFFFILEHFLYLHSCPDSSHEDCENHTLGPLAALGMGIHSFFDGVIIVFSFMADPTLGWLITLGIILHKLPAGGILHTLICHNQKNGKFWWIFAVAATTPLAAVLLPLLRNVSESQIGIGLAFSAGTLLYITLSDLLPETHRSRTKFNLVFLFLGILLIFGINQLFPG